MHLRAETEAAIRTRYANAIPGFDPFGTKNHWDDVGDSCECVAKNYAMLGQNYAVNGAKLWKVFEKHKDVSTHSSV
jgi:hypothetical protein